MPLPYRDISDLFEFTRSARPSTETLPEFAQWLNDVSGTDTYSAGLEDSWVKRASVGIDRAVEATGAPEALGEFFGNIGETFGQGEAARRAGEALPRGVVNFAPMMLAAPFTGGVSLAPGLIGALGTGVLSGADVFAQTGSKGAALTTGALTSLIGPIADIGGQLALRTVGAQLAKEGTRRVALSAGEHLANYAGGQAAALGTFELANEAQSALRGEGVYNPFTAKKLTETAIGQLPFMLADIPRVAKGISSTKAFVKTASVADDAAVARELSSIPDVETAPLEVEIGPKTKDQALLELYKERAEMAVDKDMPQPVRQRLLDKIDERLLYYMKGEKKLKETKEEGALGPEKTRMGVDLNEDTVKLIGTVDITNKDAEGNALSHFISVETADSLGFVGRRVQVPESLVRETKDLGDGKFEITVPKKYVRDAPWEDRTATLRPPQDKGAGTEELPTQPEWQQNAAEEERRLKFANEVLSRLHEETQKLQEQDLSSFEDLQDTVTKADDIRAAAGDKASMTDAELREEMRKEVEEAKVATVTVAATKVAKKAVAKAQNVVTEKQKLNKRQQNQVDRLVKAGETVGRLQVAASKAEARAKESGNVMTTDEINAMQDNSILQRHIDKASASAEGRMVEAPTEMTAAYTKWLGDTKEQEKIVKLAGGDKATAETIQKARAKSLEALLGKVTELLKIPKTVTGGKVLKESGEWSEPNSKDPNKHFATREEALAFVADKANVKKGVVWEDLQPMPRGKGAKKKYYLQERPREQIVSTEKLAAVGIEPESTQAAADERELSLDSSFAEATGTKHVSKTQEALEALAEADAMTKDDPVTTLQERISVLDDDYVANVMIDAELPNGPEDVTAFKTRVATMLRAVADGEVKYKGSNDAQASRFNEMLAQKDVAFKTEKEAKEFLNEIEEVRDLMREVAESPKGTRQMTAEPSNTFTLSKAPLSEREMTRAKLFGLDAPTPVTAIERLAKTYGQTKSIVGLVFRLLEQHKDLLKDVKLNLAMDKRPRAYYTKAQNEVTITTGWLRGSMTDLDVATTIAHETLHAVTVKAIESSPNHTMVKELERLRQLAIQRLPTEIRAKHEDAIRNRLYEKFASGEIRAIDYGLPRTSPWHDVLYGLTDVNEFTAQAFSSNAMQRFLHGETAPAQKSLMRRVVAAIAQFFGKDTESLLYQTMTATTRLFEHQKTFLSFEDVVGPMLARYGVSKNAQAGRLGSIYSFLEVRPMGETVEAKTQNIVDRAADAWDHSNKQNGLSYFEQKDVKKGVEIDQLAEAQGLTVPQGVDKEFKVSSDDLHKAIGELVKGNDPSRIKDYLILTTPGMAYHVRSLAAHALTNLEVFTKIDNLARLGLLPVTPLNKKAYVGAIEKFQGVLKAANEVINDGHSILALEAIEPQGWLVAQQDAQLRVQPSGRFPGSAQMHEDMNMAGPGTKIGKFFRDVFMPAWQLAKQHPVIAPVIELAFDHQSRVRRFATEVLAPFGVHNGELSNESVKKMEKVMRDPFLNGKIDELLLLRQEKKSLLDYQNDPADKAAMDPILSGLTSEQRASVLEVMDHQTVSILKTQGKILEGEKLLGMNSLARILQGSNQLKFQDNKLLAQETLNAFRMLRDLAQAPMGQQKLTELRAKMDEDTFIRSMQFASKETERIVAYEEFFAGRPWFATEQRFDKFVMAFKHGGKTGSVDGASLQEARDKVNRLYPGATVTREVYKQDRNNPDRNFGMSQKMLDKLQEFETAHLQALREAGVEESQIKDAESNGMVGALKREMAASGLYKPGSERKGALGRETLPMLQNHFNYVNAVANSLNKRITRSEMWLRTMDPDIVAVPELRTQGIKHIENFLAPDPELGRQLNQLNFFYYLGANLSSHVIEGGQSLLSHAAQLTAEGAGVLGGYSRLLRAASQIKDWATGIRKVDVNGRDLGWKNPEHQELMLRAKLDGEIGMGMWDEALGPVDQAALNFMRQTSGNETLSIGGLLKKPIVAYKHVTANLYGIFTHFNARLALLSAFDLYRSKGLGFDEAYQKAREFNRTANFSGGRAARPIDLFNSRGNIRTASMAMQSLQSYQLGMISMFGRFLSHGFGKGEPGVTSADRANAKKAAVQLIATQLTAAGVLGLPFVSAGVALLEQLFPDLELKKNMREIAHGVLDSDKEFGGLLSNIALQGVPSQLGVDAASRLGIGGNIAGLSEYGGYDPVNMLGPSYNLFRNIVLGVKETAVGNVTGGIQQVLPPSYKKLFDLVRNDGEMRSPSGQLLLQATPGEKFAYAVGFKPKRVADAQEADRILRRSDEIRRRETEAFNDSAAAKVLQGDTRGAQKMLLDKQKADPMFDPRAGARAVAQSVERKTLPQDLQRGGTRQGGLDRQALLRTYTTPPQEPSEVQRLQLRQQVELKLGVPGAGRTAPSEMRIALVTDQLMKSDPTLPRSLARQRAAQLVLGQRPKTLGAPLGEELQGMDHMFDSVP